MGRQVFEGDLHAVAARRCRSCGQQLADGGIQRHLTANHGDCQQQTSENLGDGANLRKRRVGWRRPGGQSDVTHTGDGLTSPVSVNGTDDQSRVPPGVLLGGTRNQAVEVLTGGEWLAAHQISMPFSGLTCRLVAAEADRQSEDHPEQPKHRQDRPDDAQNPPDTHGLPVVVDTWRGIDLLERLATLEGGQRAQNEAQATNHNADNAHYQHRRPSGMRHPAHTWGWLHIALLRIALLRGIALLTIALLRGIALLTIALLRRVARIWRIALLRRVVTWRVALLRAEFLPRRTALLLRIALRRRLVLPRLILLVRLVA